MRTKTFSGERLRDLRNGKRLTQHDLASGLRRSGFGTTQTTVSRWEDGQQPHSSVLPVLAELLGVEMDALYSDADEEPELLPSLDDALRSYLRKLIRDEVQAARA